MVIILNTEKNMTLETFKGSACHVVGKVLYRNKNIDFGATASTSRCAAGKVLYIQEDMTLGAI